MRMIILSAAMATAMAVGLTGAAMAQENAAGTNNGTYQDPKPSSKIFNSTKLITPKGRAHESPNAETIPQPNTTANGRATTSAPSVTARP